LKESVRVKNNESTPKHSSTYINKLIMISYYICWI